jgi:hypothetical protein
MLAVYQPLLGALRTHLSPGALAGFLEYASVACEDDFEDPFGTAPEDAEPDPWAPFAPGELPDLLPELPESQTERPADDSPELPALGPDAETAEVAAWCVAAGLTASVIGRWVWCDPYQQVGRDREAVGRALRGAGFGFSGRRQSYYHTCGVASLRQPGDKRRGGKLERFHGVTSAADYPVGHDARPGWKRAKDAKAKARGARP